MSKCQRPGDEGVPASRLPSKPTEIWDPQPGEPSLWFARFDVFRLLGPHRTFARAYRACAEIEGLGNKQPSDGWYGVARKWAWEERAMAWDASQREQLRAQEEARRFQARERRLGMVDEMLTLAYDCMSQANLLGMTQEEARTSLPTIRMIFRDMVTVQEREFGVQEQPQPPQGGQPVVYHADELRRIQLQLEAWRASRQGEEPNPSSAVPGQTLLVCVGADASLMVDLAALRTVKTVTGLGFHRILDVTRDGFDAYLRRERSKGRPVELVHMAVHASPAGVQFADGVVEGEWLSERLLGVRVLLLAGCEGDRVGDWLGVVPHVVTLAEEIGHADAATLTQHFWSGIGWGKGPDEALDEALAHCVPVVSEYVIRHW